MNFEKRNIKRVTAFGSGLHSSHYTEKTVKNEDLTPLSSK